ncbi:hypothetical protein GW17_00055476 [Ensete ventricosum]|nr:hypothetical protein GW17_00055476 [Ensete ventricosum]
MVGSPLRAPCSRPPLRAPRCKRVCPPTATALAGCCPRKQCWTPLRAGPGRGLAMGGHGLAVGGQPYMGAGRGWPPLLLAARYENIARIRRTILHDSILSHIV